MSEAGKEQILSETNQLPTSFEEMDLSKEVLRAIKDMGFTTPSTVQAKTIPLMMSGADVNAIAPTGTGKTCAFGIPMLEYVQLNEPEVQEVVLAPTRELALQIGDELTKLAKYIRGCRIAVLYGGQPIPKQLAALKRKPQILVATPGRLLDHMNRGNVHLNAVHTMVLDEADEMLNMGFIEDIEEIMHAMTGPKRVLLFSATMPDRIAALARNYMHDPDLLKVESQHVTTDLTNQIYFEVRDSDKFDALTRIIDTEPEFYGIVF